MSLLHVGLVGLGTMADRHIEAINQCSHLLLTALCSRDAQKLTEKANQLGVPKRFTSYDEMLLDGELDAVVIVTPTKLHAQMSIAALTAGKHVLCEKPPALCAEEAKRMLECAQKQGKQLLYGLLFRFSPKHQVANEFLQAGHCGEIYYARAGILRRSGSPGGWFTNKEMAGGGPLMDVGPHIIDLAMHLMGDLTPQTVFARTFKKTENLENVKEHSCYKSFGTAELYENNTEDFALVVINFTNGACLAVETSFSAHIKEDSFYLSLLGTKGGMSVDPDLEIYSTSNGYLTDIKPRIDCVAFDHQQAVNTQMNHFANLIRSNSQCNTSAEEGYKLMKIIDAAYASAKTGNVVQIM